VWLLGAAGAEEGAYESEHPPGLQIRDLLKSEDLGHQPVPQHHHDDASDDADEGDTCDRDKGCRDDCEEKISKRLALGVRGVIVEAHCSPISSRMETIQQYKIYVNEIEPVLISRNEEAPFGASSRI
jgi:hypothetical protein